MTKQQKNLLKSYPDPRECVRVAQVELGASAADELRRNIGLEQCPDCAACWLDPFAPRLAACWLCEGSGWVTRGEIQKLEQAKRAVA